MYGFPDNFDLTIFEKQTLVQLCFGANELILNFHGGISITVMSSIGYTNLAGKVLASEDFASEASGILSFLNRDVHSAFAQDKGTLRLVFEGGRVMEIYDDSEQWESYTIRVDGKLFVI